MTNLCATSTNQSGCILQQFSWDNIFIIIRLLKSRNLHCLNTLNIFFILKLKLPAQTPGAEPN
nr:MAG TPA: hypothetical protein [Caudoviricetes sp.]